MRWWSIALTLVTSLWTGSPVNAAGDLFEQASLQGLRAVQVVVENFAPDISRDGLDRERVKAAVERQLRQAQVTVEPQAENALYVHLGTHKNEDGVYSYALSLQLLQLVLLFRDPGLVTWGTTWSLDQVGSVSPAKVSDLESLIARGVNTFVEDYQIANPIVR
jgi:hypothetical protein